MASGGVWRRLAASGGVWRRLAASGGDGDAASGGDSGDGVGIGCLVGLGRLSAGPGGSAGRCGGLVTRGDRADVRSLRTWLLCVRAMAIHVLGQVPSSRPGETASTAPPLEGAAAPSGRLPRHVRGKG